VESPAGDGEERREDRGGADAPEREERSVALDMIVTAVGIRQDQEDRRLRGRVVRVSVAPEEREEAPAYGGRRVGQELATQRDDAPMVGDVQCLERASRLQPVAEDALPPTPDVLTAIRHPRLLLGRSRPRPAARGERAA